MLLSLGYLDVSSSDHGPESLPLELPLPLPIPKNNEKEEEKSGGRVVVIDLMEDSTKRRGVFEIDL